ncbi:MAG: hypothetical protein QOC55_1231 [Thermoleophilaceae bacterium]|nr:hypothetical protein [Thermoleophilaceae bacterium]
MSLRARVPSGRVLGLAAVAFSLLYLISDGVEALQGGFSRPQLWLTLAAEAAVPVIVVGLYRAQRPQIGRLGRVSAITYAYSFTFFTATVVYALAARSPDYRALSAALQPWMTLHGALMVFAGIGFARAVVRAGILPRWTGAALAAGVVLVAAAQGAPEGVQVLAAGIRDMAFAGMGLALLRAPARARFGHQDRRTAVRLTSGRRTVQPQGVAERRHPQ